MIIEVYMQHIQSLMKFFFGQENICLNYWDVSGGGTAANGAYVRGYIKFEKPIIYIFMSDLKSILVQKLPSLGGGGPGQFSGGDHPSSVLNQAILWNFNGLKSRIKSLLLRAGVGDGLFGFNKLI
ncbi:hypothetical protein TVAGG3_0500420 [Trichomonas vaginalis G3]|uniref:hypothetical protein n=1 Tax=Trichomonas vaginalis (strain ATCC PRA-98 / G3) TaxID=412133 RepID=UPI0021E530BD|nr:hypothetical protein TVAGG3_0500420 [Trichomonas vaginalis G3]KAI5517035.1 hypothetical protein TVAGG3_0500420 [Trichomonas vaginalis G3]